MVPTDYTAEEWRRLKFDLVAQLSNRGVVRPCAILVADLRSWFAPADRDAVVGLLAELVADDDCPIEFVGADDDAVWLTSTGAAERFLALR